MHFKCQLCYIECNSGNLYLADQLHAPRRRPPSPVTVTLNAMLNNTPFLTNSVRLMPTDIFVYLPLVLKQ